jgi:hypothetical protein
MSSPSNFEPETGVNWESALKTARADGRRSVVVVWLFATRSSADSTITYRFSHVA